MKSNTTNTEIRDAPNGATPDFTGRPWVAPNTAFGGRGHPAYFQINGSQWLGRDNGSRVGNSDRVYNPKWTEYRASFSFPPGGNGGIGVRMLVDNYTTGIFVNDHDLTVCTRTSPCVGFDHLPFAYPVPTAFLNAAGPNVVRFEVLNEEGYGTGGLDFEVVTRGPDLATAAPDVSGVAGQTQTVSGRFVQTFEADPVSALHLMADNTVGTFTDNHDGTWSWTYTPTPASSNAPRTIMVTADDGQGGAAADAFVSTVVNRAPTAGGSSVSTAEDTPVTFTLAADDPDGQTLTATPSIPTHGAVACTGLVCTYTPAHDYNGSDTFSYTVSDGHGGTTGPAEVSITVTPVNDQAVARGSSFATPEDTPTTFELIALDDDGDTLAFSVVSQPDHGSVSCSPSGTCLFTPEADYAGEDDFVFAVDDGQGASRGNMEKSYARVHLSVHASNDAPVTGPSTASTDEDTAVTFAVPGTDVEGDALDTSVTDAPAHGHASCSALQCTYTPDADVNGVDGFAYTVSDGHDGSDTARATVTVAAANDSPVAHASSIVTDEDTERAFAVSATDPDGDALSYSVSTPADHGTVACDPTGACTYVPAADSHGADTFRFTADDGHGGSDTATVSIDVTSVNDAPDAQAATAATAEDTTVTFALHATDADGDPLSYTVTQAPSAGSLDCSAAGACTYIPVANAHGTQSAVFRADDGHGGADTAPVTITVQPVNDAPTAKPLTVTLDQETTADIALVGADIDGDPLAYTITSPPAHGSVTCTAALCHYTPTTDYHGADTLTYRVTDPGGLSASARVAITVTTVTRATKLDVPGVVNIRHSGLLGLTITLPFQGTLTRVPGGAPVAGRRITFVAGGQTACSALTNARGTASCTATLKSLLGVVLSLGYTGVFDGDGQYNASSDSGRLVS